MVWDIFEVLEVVAAWWGEGEEGENFPVPLKSHHLSRFLHELRPQGQAALPME